MTSARRDEGSSSGGRLREGINAMWPSTQKIRAHRRHPVLFSCKEVAVFGPEFCVWIRIKGINFCQSKLLIQVTNSIHVA